MMNDNYSRVLESARFTFAQKDPREMASRGAAAFLNYPPLSVRYLVIPYLGRIYRISWPQGEVLEHGTFREASFPTSLIILHYLTRATGQPPQGKWLSFKELWGGQSFNAAYEQRALKSLASFFHKRPEFFYAAALKMGGLKVPSHKGCLLFALPRIPLLLLLSPGDEEVPTKSTILFDATANCYLETEDLAVVGESLAARLVKAVES